MASSESLPLYEMRRTWALVDLLTSLSKRRANHHPPPTAELLRRKFETLPLPALDTLPILVDQTIAEQHGRLGPSQVCGMAKAVRSFPEATAAEVAYAHACGQVVSDATVKAASVQTSHLLRIGFEHLALARQKGIPLFPIATGRHTHALDTLAKDRANNRRAALDHLGVDDADIPEDGGFVSSKGLLTGAACCIAVMDHLDRRGDICCGSCYEVVRADELVICRRCGDQLLCRDCLAGLGSHAAECKRVRAEVRSAAEALAPRLRESARQVAVVRLNGSGLMVPVHITSLASAMVPSSLAEALSRCPTEMNHPATVLYWRLLVAFLSNLEGDDQEAIDYERVHHVQAAECAEAETPPAPRGPPRLLPSERRRLQKEAKAAERSEHGRRHVRLRRQRPWRRQMRCSSGRRHGRTQPVRCSQVSCSSGEARHRQRSSRAPGPSATRSRPPRCGHASRPRQSLKSAPRPNDCRVRGSWLRPSSSNGALAHGSGVARSCSAGSAAVPQSSFSSRFGPGYSSK